MTVLYHRLISKPQLTGEQIEWKKDSRGLVVLLHGVSDDPAAWFAQKSLLEKVPTIDVFAPVIPKRGLCSLEEAAIPILSTLLDYIKKNPKKPVCLLGISNGSRIAAWIEVQLRKRAPQTPVKISSIAAIYLGSSRINFLEKIGIAKYFYPEVLTNELKYKSGYSNTLLHQIQAPLTDGCASRDYEFYASIDDLTVPDLDSSLPTLGKGERYYVVQGQSHDSIVAAVAEQQIASCIHWIISQ